MNRKHFLSSIISAGAVITLLNRNTFASDIHQPQTHIPLYLKQGELIGVTCPAGHMTSEEIQPALDQIQNWGFKIAVGKTINQRDYSFGGTDRERAADLQQMIDNPSIKAIICARGGYGLVRIIDQIDFTNFVKAPKWIIGFSDITVSIVR